MTTATKKKGSTQLKLQPLGDRLVIRREDSEERTEGGIYLPDSAKNKPTRGVVVSVGDGRLLDNGTRAPMQVKAGDRVLFTSYAGEAIEIGDDEFLLMGEGELLAVIE
jgi:chaperonin GroES